MKNTELKRISRCLLFFSALLADGQRAASLRAVQTVYVGSLGAGEGADELKRELEAAVRHDHRLRLVTSVAQADIALEGRGELWIRGYHSLSPRARANPLSAEASYAGYLSIKALGNGGEVLWSYLATPGRVSVGELKRQLAGQVVDKLTNEIQSSAMAALPATHDLPADASTEPQLNLRGSGATFPFPLYQDWFHTFHALHPAWNFDYQPVGSEAGVEQLASGVVDFAGSDIPPAFATALGTEARRAVPSVGGAVVLIYNLPRFSEELRLTADVLAGIYRGTITTWNDPALRAINPHRSMPNAPIVPIHRADGSGSTFALTEYLSKVNRPWKEQTGFGARVKGMAGREAAGNEGVAQLVATTPYSIGYVEFIYAFYHHVSVASIQSASGDFVQPDLPSIAAAANGALTNDASITNSSAPGAYPIATFSWLIFKDSLDPAKRAAFLRFVDWMLTSGQKQCSALGYAPLPPALLKRQPDSQQKNP